MQRKASGVERCPPWRLRFGSSTLSQLASSTFPLLPRSSLRLNDTFLDTSSFCGLLRNAIHGTGNIGVQHMPGNADLAANWQLLRGSGRWAQGTHDYLRVGLLVVSVLSNPLSTHVNTIIAPNSVVPFMIITARAARVACNLVCLWYGGLEAACSDIACLSTVVYMPKCKLPVAAQRHRIRGL